MPNRWSAMRGSREIEPHRGGEFPDEEVTLARGAGKVRTIESLMRSHVLPNVARHHPKPKNQGRAARKIFTEREIVRFVDHAVAGNTNALTDTVGRARQLDVSFEDIWLGLLQPAARVLGERWATDVCDFATVTLAMCQLHSLLRRYSPLFTASPTGPLLMHRVLLTPGADEQHSFGAVMVAEFLRREGCEVVMGPFENPRSLVAAVRQTPFTIVGFSLSCDNKVPELARQIASVRRASKNPALAILVGGRVFNEHPELLSRVGADWTARDARDVVTLLRRLAVSAEI